MTDVASQRVGSHTKQKSSSYQKVSYISYKILSWCLTTTTRSLKNSICYVYIKCLLANIHMLWIHLNSWGQVSWFEKRSFASSSSYIMPTLQVRNLQKSLYITRRVAQTRYCTVVHGFLFNNLTSQFNSIQIFYWIKCINLII